LQFPWRDGNRFTLLADNETFFARMLQAIDDAGDSILLEMYLLSSGQLAGRFIDALLRAAQRDVAVYLLLDDFGARGLSSSDRQRLRHPRIQLVWHNPLRLGRFRRYLARDHRKLLLIDGQLAFTGGFGISDEFCPSLDPAQGWRDTLVEIRGPVVHDWHRLFGQTWQQWGGLPLLLDAPSTTQAAGAARGCLRASRGIGGGHMNRNLVLATLRARERVWIATAYFIPSRRLRRSLRRRAREGLDVRLLLPGPITDHPGIRHASRRYYAGLLRHGVRIFEYQPRFMHSKLVLCDHWVSIGSSNFDRWNLRRNLEANQEIDDAGVAAAARALFEQDFLLAEEIRYPDWRQRPWHQRLREWAWRRIELLLDKDD
jgi:phosphatidylserine/phosphatidylglycerophosphate/cardiolipin synthase-like enzyme